MKNKFKGKTGFKTKVKSVNINNNIELQKYVSEKLSTDKAMQKLADKLNELDNDTLSDIQLKIKKYFFLPSMNAESEIKSRSFVMCKWARDFYDCDLEYNININDDQLLIIEPN